MQYTRSHNKRGRVAKGRRRGKCRGRGQYRRLGGRGANEVTWAQSGHGDETNTEKKGHVMASYHDGTYIFISPLEGGRKEHGKTAQFPVEAIRSEKREEINRGKRKLCAQCRKYEAAESSRVSRGWLQVRRWGRSLSGGQRSMTAMD